MVLTAEQAQFHARDTLGIGVNDTTSVPIMQILNAAGEQLCTCYEWAWLSSQMVTLSYEENQSHVWLPRDLLQIIGIEPVQGLNTSIQLTDLQFILDLRTKTVIGENWTSFASLIHAARTARATGSVIFTGVPTDTDTVVLDDGVHTPVTFEFSTDGTAADSSYVVVDISAATTAADAAEALQDAIVSSFQAQPLDIEAVIDASATGTVLLTNRRLGTSGNVSITDSADNLTVTGMSGGLDGGNPEPRLELWPTPTTATEDALRLFYRAGWLHLNEEGDIIRIPQWLERAYVSMVRAYARGYEGEDVEPLEARILRVVNGPEMQAALRIDARMQTDFGPRRGGQFNRTSYSPFWNGNTVSDPS